MKAIINKLIIILTSLFILTIFIGDPQRRLKLIDVDVISTEQAEGNLINIPDRTSELSKIKAINSDASAWIYIPGTTIDSPIMQAKGKCKEFYERKNEYKKYAFEGCIWCDDDIKLSPFNCLSENVVILGHNLDDNKNGKRFAQLVKFQNKEFAENTPYIFLTTEDCQLIYEIYAVFFTDIKFKFYSTQLDEATKTQIIKESIERSEYIYDVNVSGKDKLITLITCTYKYGPYESWKQKNTRFVVQGKLVTNNNKLLNKAKIIKNSNIKCPNI